MPEPDKVTADLDLLVRARYPLLALLTYEERRAKAGVTGAPSGWICPAERRWRSSASRGSQYARPRAWQAAERRTSERAAPVRSAGLGSAPRLQIRWSNAAAGECFSKPGVRRSPCRCTMAQTS